MLPFYFSIGLYILDYLLHPNMGYAGLQIMQNLNKI